MCVFIKLRLLYKNFNSALDVFQLKINQMELGFRQYYFSDTLNVEVISQ